MVYVRDGDGDYLDDNAYAEGVPTGKEAGTYKVWYKVLGDENHNDTEPVSVEVTIAAAPADDTSKPDNSTSNPATGAAAEMGALAIAAAAVMITKKKK